MTQVTTRPMRAADQKASGVSNPNPYVFIVGCARSGTTLLQRMVDAHPSIAITPETHWLSTFFRERIGLTPDAFVTPELIPNLVEYRTFPNLGIDQSEIEHILAIHAPMHYRKFVTRIFDIYGRARGKPLVGDKSPAYVQKIHTLHKLWRRAKFVHLLRDGRDVCLSVLDWDNAWRTAGRLPTWRASPVLTTALWWKRKVLLGREEGQRLDCSLYYEIRYEALVREPVVESTRLCSYLGLPYDGAMVRYHEGRAPDDPYLGEHHRWYRIAAAARDWRTQMTDWDIELFEAAAGDLLGELGYERAFLRPRVAALNAASRIENAFTRNLRARGEQIPERWKG